ncbi:MAG TPA: c-type cytochrome biogenesis protein CcsB [Dissulfurispiraceae bacterium]|nr:c-type cytochrome biogenesis protein CcsB [Dissulfurispiraceae bacterium]
MDSSFFFGVATIVYILAMVAYISYLAFKNSAIGVIATTATVVGFVSQTIAFGMRWKEFYEIGRMGILRAIPLTNLYESLVFFVWCLILGYLVIEWKYRTRSFGAFITPIAGITLAFISIAGVSTEIQPLVPALQSNWLLAHVTMSFISYAAFAISCATALMYLAVTADKRNGFPYIFWTVTLAIFIASFIAMGFDFVTLKVSAKSPQAFIQNYLFKATFRSGSGFIVGASSIAFMAIAFVAWRYGFHLRKIITTFSLTPDMLDDLTYKAIAVGFPVFTLGGLIFGAIWADQAWGKYWSWDPKETWSLITWFVYAFYLHARHIRGWRGSKIAVLAVIGFASTIFTYLGVNLLLSGLHSYGSMQ